MPDKYLLTSSYAVQHAKRVDTDCLHETIEAEPLNLQLFTRSFPAALHPLAQAALGAMHTEKASTGQRA